MAAAGLLANQPRPTDADIEAFYKQNEALFRAPEQASIEYVVLDLAVLKKAAR